MHRLALIVVGIAVLFGVTTAVAGGAPGAETRWVFTDLGTLGGPSSFAVAINNRGDIIGYSDTNKKCGRGYECIEHAFLWEGGKMIDLADDSGAWSYAAAINDRGQVLLNEMVPAVKPQDNALLWEKGKVTDLGSIPGKLHCYGKDINERGQVVGWCEDSPRRASLAFLWKKGRMISLGTLAPSRRRGGSSAAVAINERGQIVGAYRTPQATMRAFLWERGKMIDLGTLPGLKNSRATAINDRGQILGYGYLKGEYVDRAFLWENGRMKDLGPTSGSHRDFLNPQDSATQLINASGQVIAPRFFWRNGKRIDLDFRARDLNDGGQIVGMAGAWEDASPVLWKSGKRTVLATVPRAKAGEAVAINDRSQIVGCSGPGGCDTETVHAVLWTLKHG